MTGEVRLLSLPATERLGAAHDRDPDAARLLTVVSIHGDGGNIGWGECSALNRPTYNQEWADGAFEQLAGFTGKEPLSPMAAAAIEMAGLDLGLRSGAPISLAQSLGVTRTSVPAGAAVGLMPEAELVARVEDLVSAGFGRLKLKIEPGHDLEPVSRVRQTFPDLEVHVDANGSFVPTDVELLVTMAATGVSAIEQPFPAEELGAASRLVDLLAESGCHVVADEAAGNLGDVVRLREAGALSAVSVKAPRLGGVAKAVELIDWCQKNGVAATVGGMLESALGRHSMAALAAVDGVNLVGDLSPSKRWLANDPWPDLAMVESSILVPTGPGVAPPPDLDTLSEMTLRSAPLPRALLQVLEAPDANSAAR